MTREEAFEYIFQNDKSFYEDINIKVDDNGNIVYKRIIKHLYLHRVKNLINKIFDDFEKQNSCGGCKNKPKKGDNYPMKCGVCRRFYGDMYEYES